MSFADGQAAILNVGGRVRPAADAQSNLESAFSNNIGPWTRMMTRYHLTAVETVGAASEKLKQTWATIIR